MLGKPPTLSSVQYVKAHTKHTNKIGRSGHASINVLHITHLVIAVFSVIFTDTTMEVPCRKCTSPLKEKSGDTALMRASYNGHHLCLKELIQAGANVNQSDLHGNTALIKASTLAYYDCV